MSTEAAARRKTWTPEEYLAWERASPEKHEFFQGEVFAMAGATKEHNLIVGNIVGELRNALRSGLCQVYPSDLRVKIPATGLYTYPDASVVCSKPKLEDDSFDTLLNPEVIFEVLSDSSENYDRGKKFEQYRTVASLREYILVAQDRVLVEQYTRMPDGAWVLREHRQGGRLDLACIGCALDVGEIYLKVFGAAASTSA
jgi:Uma2 family endonuclease